MLWQLETPHPLRVPLTLDPAAPHAFLPYVGGLASLALTSGELRWTSVRKNLDALVGSGVVSGGPGGDALVATSATPGGGVFLFDPAFGGLLATISGLADDSGVEPAEILLHDLDGDGALEIAFGVASYYAPGVLYVVDFPTGPDAPQVVTYPFEGYSGLTPLHAGPVLAGGATGLVVSQGPSYTLIATCSEGSPGAVCALPNPSICLCPAGALGNLHPGHMLGMSFVANVTGDEAAELIAISNDPSISFRAVGLFSLADGVATQPADLAAATRWYYDYSAHSPLTQLSSPASGPVDLDGDGTLELIVSFVHNGGADRSRTGAPANDGIDFMDGIAVGVFDVVTGALEASLLAAVAYGTVDLDGDGSLELVTSPTKAWALLPGVYGHELVCVLGTCKLSQVWSDPSRTLVRSPSVYQDVSLPPPKLFGTEVEKDGKTLGVLLTYGAGTLDALGLAEGGALEVKSSSPLVPEEEMIARSARGRLLTGTRSEVRLRGPLGATLDAPVAYPRQGPRPWFAARFAAGEVAAQAIYDSVLYQTADAGSPPALDTALLPRTLLAEDIDVDGQPEILSCRLPEDELGPGFEVRLHAKAPGVAGLTTRWSSNSATVPELAGFTILCNPLTFAVGQVDGAGPRDIVFFGTKEGKPGYVLLDGETGAIDAVVAEGIWPHSGGALRMADLFNDKGEPLSDGRDDLVVPGSYEIAVYNFDVGGKVASRSTGFYYAVGGYADLGGLGTLSHVATGSGQMEAVQIEDSLLPTWPTPITKIGPSTLDLGQVQSFVAADATQGLDPVYLTGQGGVEVFSGATGARLPGFPVFPVGGELSASQPSPLSISTAVMTLDVDDDGHEEVVVGSLDGWLYAIDVAAAETVSPKLSWSFFAGAPIKRLAAADLDGDGYVEVLVSAADGRGLVIGATGVALDILEPIEGMACVPFSKVAVSGTSTGVHRVDLSAGGISGDLGTLVGQAGGWSGSVLLRGPGAHAILAEGFDEAGHLLVVAAVQVFFGGDADEDGVTPCGGDCDDQDAFRSPLLAEVCEDGIDQDCDGQDAPCPTQEPGPELEPAPDALVAEGEPAVAEREPATKGSPRGCDCDQQGRIPWNETWLVVLLGLWVRSRATARR
jgi:hypothetical protein